MVDGEKSSLPLQFNPKVRLAFHGSTIISDAGLCPLRDQEKALSLTSTAGVHLRNVD